MNSGVLFYVFVGVLLDVTLGGVTIVVLKWFAGWLDRRKGRKMNVAEVCRTLQRVKERIVESQLRDLGEGERDAKAEVRDALACIDEALHAGRHNDPRFPDLARRAGEACEAAAMAQAFRAMKAKGRRTRKTGRKAVFP